MTSYFPFTCVFLLAPGCMCSHELFSLYVRPLLAPGCMRSHKLSVRGKAIASAGHISAHRFA